MLPRVVPVGVALYLGILALTVASMSAMAAAGATDLNSLPTFAPEDEYDAGFMHLFTLYEN